MDMAQAKMTIAPREGETWINPISGQEYKWREAKGGWVPTGRYPFGSNPMGFLGDGA
jgi:hypothetical protein